MSDARHFALPMSWCSMMREDSRSLEKRITHQSSASLITHQAVHASLITHQASGIRHRLQGMPARYIPSGAKWFASKMESMIFKAVDDAGQMLGWIALSPVSKRRVYAGVAEVSSISLL